MLSRKVAIRRSSSSFLGFAAAGVLAAGSRNRMLLRFVLHGLLWAVVGSGAAVLPSAEAQDLNVNSDTTISSSVTYDNTYVAPSASDLAWLDVTTGGVLTNNAELFVGLSGTGTLYVSGGSVTNATGYLGYNNDSFGIAYVLSGTWATSGDLWVGYTYTDPENPSSDQNGYGQLNMRGGLVTVSGVLNRGTLGVIYLLPGATLQIGTGGAGSGLAVGDLEQEGTLAFNQSDDYTYSDAISGYGAVTKAGTGTLTLNGNNSFRGGVTISEGTLFMGSNNALGSDGSLAVNGGTLDLRGRSLTVNALSGSSAGMIQSGVSGAVTLTATAATNSTFAGTINNGSGTVGFTKSGAGTLTFSGSNGYSGRTTISGGTLAMGSNNALGNGGSLAVNGGTLDLGGRSLTVNALSGSSAGMIQSGVSGAVTLTATAATSSTFAGTIRDGSGSIGFIKSGNGTLTLSASNGYTGRTQVNGGVLSLGNTNALAGTGTISFGGGSLQYSASNTRDYSAKILYSGSAIAIDTNGQSVTFASGLDSSNTGGLTKTGLGTLTLTASNGYTGGTTITSGTLQIGNGGTTGSINGNVVNNATLAFNRSNASIFSGVISGTGGLAISSSGAVTLTGNNTYTGVTTVRQTGTAGSVALQIGNGGTTGSIAGNVVITATTGADYSLVFNRSDDLTYSGTITAANGPGGMRKLGAGTLTLTGSFQTGAGIKVSEGAVQIGDGGTTGAFNGAVVLENNSSFIYNRSVDLTRYSLLSGTGTLIKRGAGTLTLGGTSNTYSGGTTISGGALATGTSGALPTGAAVTITSGTLDLSGYSATIGTLSGSAGGTITSGSSGSITLTSTSATNSTYAGTITNGLGTMAFAKQGAGTLTLSGSSSYTGATMISGGVLAYGASNALSDLTAVTVAGGGLNLGSYNDTVASFTITSGSLYGSGKLTAATYALCGGTVTGNLGGGSMTVTANSNVNGTADATSASLNVGTLTLGSAGRFTSNQVALTGSAGGSISLGGSESVGSLAGGFNVALGSATLTTGNDNTSTTYSGILNGSGGLTKTGTGKFTISGANSYAGVTTITGGTIALSGTGSIGTGGLNLGTTGSPGVFDLGALTAGTYSLPTTGNLAGAGTISGSGKSLAVLGSLAPGNSVGTITVGTGLSLDLSNSGSSVFEITSPTYTAGTYDLVSGSGSVVFGGILNLAFSGSYADGTNVLQIFANTGGRSGNFSAVNATGLAAGQSATFNPATGFITVVPEPSTYAMALAALACGGYSLFRRRRTR